MKKLVKLLLGSILLLGIVLGAICLIQAIVNWTCADMGRFILFISIMVYIIYRLIRKEFDE